ncbi:serpin family protein [Paenibacillus sp. CC-CFT747]|nr:serpin family protein [Paenibacillus sp. CC-CFT747]
MTRPSSIPNPQKKFRFLVNPSGLSRLRQRGTPAAKLPGKAGPALLTACLVLLTACGMKGEGISMEKRAHAAAALDPAIVKAQNAFGLKLHQQLVRGDKEKNVFLSPVSVSMALAMTYNGSAGETREAMSRTLGWEGWKPEQVNGGNRTMKELLEKSGKGIQLNIANSMWMMKGLAFSKSFLQTNREYYDAYVKELDFSKADAAPTINRWVKDKTNGKIPVIVDGLSPQDRMVLINAIYFKGTWKDEFSPSRTKEEDFRLPGGSTVNVPMMARSGSYEYLEEPGFQAIRLPYGEGQMDMLVILPEEGSSLEALHEKLWSDASPWQKAFGTRQGKSAFPALSWSSTAS